MKTLNHSLAFVTVCLALQASAQADTSTDAQLETAALQAENEANLMGMWGQVVRGKGTSNVMQFMPDGQVTVRPYNCDQPKEQPEPIEMTYTLDMAAQKLVLQNDQKNEVYEVRVILPNAMLLRRDWLGLKRQDIEYMKLPGIFPLCFSQK